LKWVGGTAIDTPTIGSPRYETQLIGGKGEKVIVGYNRAKGGRGKQDDVLIYKGKTYFVDYKVGKDTQKDDQKKVQNRIERAGGTYLLIHSIYDVYDLIDEANKAQELF
jgi:hypothetical protein